MGHLTNEELDALRQEYIGFSGEVQLELVEQAKEANALRAEVANLKECLADDGDIISGHVEARREAEQETNALRARCADLERLLAHASRCEIRNPAECGDCKDVWFKSAALSKEPK